MLYPTNRELFGAVNGVEPSDKYLPAPYPSAVLLLLLEAAVPVPLPAPVAVNTVPGFELAAPIKVKSVVPVLIIVYDTPVMNNPAVTVFPDE